jgi:hypothetical protein
VISYEGALVSPAGGSRPWPARHRAATKAALRSVLNRQLRRDPTPEPYDALRDDPVVGPPAYGATQAGRRQVPAENKDQPDWLEQLNTEPQHRAVAGLGAEVVRADQEALMAAAWEHAAGLREVNHVLTNARLAWELARGTKPTLAALADPDLVQVAGPAMARLPHPGGTTVRGAVAASALPAGLVSSTFRRLTRTVRAFTLPAATATATVDAGPAASRVAASSAVTAAALGDPVGFTASWADVHPPMGAELKGDLPGGTDAAVNPPGLAAAAQVRSQGQAPGSRSREAASATVYDFPRPFVDWDNLIRYTGQADVIADLPADVRTALDPAGTIVAMLQTRITGLPADRGDDVPAMLTTQPSFTTPMSQRLLALSANYVVPGVGLIPDNTLGLLEANREFVESFLAGLNRELGREFVWREYPVRLQATWARQFWDTGPGGPADIAPIGQWAAGTALGTHPAGPAQASLVLLLKGALPRRYPDMRVYAVEAAWDGGSRREKAGGEVRLPLFAVSLGPDVRVYGFALEERQARGSTDPRRPPGWFFVLEEQPGAARFGLHAPGQGDRGKAPGNWAGLSWAHLVDDAEPLPGFVDTGGPPWLLAAGRRAGNGPDGERDAWGTDAAAMARITFQRPVRMLIHADSMLPPGPGVSRPPASLGPAEPGPAGHGPSGRCR